MDKKKASIEMAKRLRALRKGKGLSYEKLQLELKEKYELDISKSSLMNYEVTDEFHSKFGLNFGMKCEYLRCFADYYGVSADYLLGLSDTHAMDMSIKSLSAAAGLSEYAVEALCPSARLFIPDSTQTLNLLLSSEQFPRLLSDLSTFFFGRSVNIDTKTFVGTEEVVETVSVLMDTPGFSEWLKEIVEPAMLSRINHILYEIKEEEIISAKARSYADGEHQED